MQAVKRLFNQFKPTNYKLQLGIDRLNRNFDGSVIISGESNISNDKLFLHSKDLTIKSVKVDGIVSDFQLKEDDILAIKTDQKSPKEISIDFTGIINDKMHGMYPCYYQINGNKKELLATQFESHHAREVFPCIDEPEAKATFDLTLITEPGVTAISNMHHTDQTTRDGWMTTVFEQTPKMSTYLLAWVIGDINKKTAYSKKGVEVNAYAAINQPVNQLDFALDIATKTIDFYEEYFGIPYPLKKLDQVALPDFSSGAMENWGLITYRDSLLLIDDRSSVAAKHTAALVIAHEISHQWFGNLVTMKWWDDLWLNESFATLAEYIAINAIKPEWNIWLDFINDDVMYAINRDSLPGVQAVKTSVNHPDEIGGLFDSAIVYAKGARLINMILNLIGEDSFKKGLKDYFQKHAYKNTIANDLWESLENSCNIKVSEIMNKWLTKPGLPRVTIEINDKKIILKQQRLLPISEAQDNESVWPIPLLSSNESMPKIMNDFELTIESIVDDIILLNTSCVSHFITEYPIEIIGQLESKISNQEIDSLVRLQLLNERSLLAKRGIVSNSTIVTLLKAYENETDKDVWSAIDSSFNNLINFARADQSVESLVRKAAQKISAKQYDQLGMFNKETDSDHKKILRNIVVGLSLYGRNRSAIDQAISVYNSTNLADIDSELRSIVLSTKMHHEGDTQILRELLNIYTTTNSSELRSDILSGLVSVKKEELIDELLGCIKNPEIVKLQDVMSWTIYLMRNKYSKEKTWQWLRDNWQWIVDQFGGDKSYGDFARYTASSLTTKKDLEEYRQFFEPMLEIPALTRTIEIGIKELSSKIELLEKDLPAVKKALENF